MAYALSLSGLLTTFRHHFVQRPHAFNVRMRSANSIVSILQRGRVTSRLGRVTHVYAAMQYNNVHALV